MSHQTSMAERFSSVDDLISRITSKLNPPAPAKEPKARTQDAEKTRFLSFRIRTSRRIALDAVDPVAEANAPARPETVPPGRLTIVDGPGVGTTFPLGRDVARIGRAEDQDIRLDFGDIAVSRQSHATIVYYGPDRGFLIRDGRKPNPVLLNRRSLAEEAYLADGDRIRVGETTLVFSDGQASSAT